MVFNATVNNFPVISWWSILLPQVIDKFNHIILYRVHPVWLGFELTNLVVIYTDCTGSCKSNYHTIMTMMAPLIIKKYTCIILKNQLINFFFLIKKIPVFYVKI